MEKQIVIQYRPHTGQSKFHESRARFKLLACGRRWGKTRGGANEFIKEIVKAPPSSVGFCVAPTYWHTQKQWREFFTFCPAEIITGINRSDKHVTLAHDRHVWFKSADNPDSLRSEGIYILWVDEGGQMKEEAWTLALRPALMDCNGKGIFTGTPKGKNWYFHIYTRGQDEKQTDYESWNYSSLDNPYIDPKEVAEFARDMPELAYKQEILGMFLDEVGSVFRNVKDYINKEIALESKKDHRYVIGCDVAKHVDYTVLVALGVNTGAVCGFERFSQLDWELQLKRITQFVGQYNSGRLLIDSTGVGDPIYDRLRRMGLHVDGYKFTNATKADLVENLSVLLDRDKLSYPDIPELLNELGLFGYTVSAAGVTRYGAPEGYHDDCVIALALAAWQMQKPEAWVQRINW